MTDLAAEQFVCLTTFRRDGTPVGTALWVVEDGDHLYVWTGSQTGEVKRIRNNPAVTIAPATRSGKPTGTAVPAKASIVAMNDQPQVWPKFTAKYGLGLRMVTALENLPTALHIGAVPQAGRPHLPLENGSLVLRRRTLAEPMRMGPSPLLRDGPTGRYGGSSANARLSRLRRQGQASGIRPRDEGDRIVVSQTKGRKSPIPRLPGGFR